MPKPAKTGKGTDHRKAPKAIPAVRFKKALQARQETIQELKVVSRGAAERRRTPFSF